MLYHKKQNEVFEGDVNAVSKIEKTTKCRKLLPKKRDAKKGGTASEDCKDMLAFAKRALYDEFEKRKTIGLSEFGCYV